MEHTTLDTTNVFVKFLPPGIDDQALRDLFSPYGKIISSKVMLDPATWKSLGYGFVKYSREEEASAAIKAMSGTQIHNKMLMCKLSNAFAFSAPSPNLYIKPLPSNFTEEQLMEMFSQYGTIHTVKIVRDPVKLHDVVGLDTFVNPDCALSAINATHGLTLQPSWPPLTVKYAESDVQRAQRKANISPPSQKRQPPQTTSLFPIGGFQTNCMHSPVYYDFPECAPAYGPHGYPVYSILLSSPSQVVHENVAAGWYNSSTNRFYPCTY